MPVSRASAPLPPRARIVAAKRVVLKVGTNVLMRDDGRLALGRLSAVVESVANLAAQRREVLLVTSGAVGLGAQKLGLPEGKRPTVAKQACAAVGQGRLMATWERAFESLGLVVAQVLLTGDDFAVRERYLNLRATLEKLLDWGVVPILNENDVVSTAELAGRAADGRRPVFGDNDQLSALVASKMDADLLVLLSDVDGLFTGNPRTDAGARLVPTVAGVTPEVERWAGAPVAGARGRGGMPTKLMAARIVNAAGGMAVIANGRSPGILDRLFAGEEVGTLFLPGESLSGRKRWIAFASSPAGRLRVNDGARAALVDRGGSLLPAGVVAVEGRFAAGDVVSLESSDGVPFARGVARVARREAERRVKEGTRGAVLVHRDDIVVLGPRG